MRGERDNTSSGGLSSLDYSDINGISHSLTLTYISNPAEDVLTGLEDRSSGQAGSVMDPILINRGRRTGVFSRIYMGKYPEI